MKSEEIIKNDEKMNMGDLINVKKENKNDEKIV